MERSFHRRDFSLQFYRFSLGLPSFLSGFYSDALHNLGSKLRANARHYVKESERKQTELA
uniref:Uncharacterized protein n=1 Tax=Anguilla anguilla TaxID=7936 RepID=A0A0E9SL94_ANGAN